MWHIYELVLQYMGNLNEIANLMSITRKELGRFTGSIQSPEVWGEYARHADGKKYKAPADPMTRAGTQDFCKQLIEKWVDHKAGKLGV